MYGDHKEEKQSWSLLGLKGLIYTSLKTTLQADVSFWDIF